MILGWFFTATFSSIYIITFAYLLKGISIGGGLASMFVCIFHSFYSLLLLFCFDKQFCFLSVHINKNFQILITECATPIWRNCLIVSVYLSYYFGLVVPTIIENFIHRDNIIWFGLFASIKIAYFIYLTPSSPIWLARTGKYEQCLHDLLWLRGDIIIANDELDTIIQIINNESKDFQYIEENICETCFRRSVARSLMSVVMLKIFVWITDLQYLSTNNATTIFSNDINHMQAFCILFIAFILLNRRHFTVGCGLISAINIFCYGLYIKFVTTSIELNTILLLTKWTMSILYSITNSVFHIVPIFIITEIQPTHKRGPVVASSFAVYFFIKNVAQILCAPLFGSSLTVKILSTPGLFMFLAFFALVLTVIIALMLTDKKSNRNLTLTL